MKYSYRRLLFLRGDRSSFANPLGSVWKTAKTPCFGFGGTCIVVYEIFEFEGFQRAVRESFDACAA